MAAAAFEDTCGLLQKRTPPVTIGRKAGWGQRHNHKGRRSVCHGTLLNPAGNHQSVVDSRLNNLRPDTNSINRERM